MHGCTDVSTRRQAHVRTHKYTHAHRSPQGLPLSLWQDGSLARSQPSFELLRGNPPLTPGEGGCAIPEVMLEKLQEPHSMQHLAQVCACVHLLQHVCFYNLLSRICCSTHARTLRRCVRACVSAVCFLVRACVCVLQHSCSINYAAPHLLQHLVQVRGLQTGCKIYCVFTVAERLHLKGLCLPVEAMKDR